MTKSLQFCYCRWTIDALLAIAAEVILFLKADKYFKSNFLFKTLLFCAIVSFIRWIFTYLVENFFILLIVQTLHGVTFALTHYCMIFFINKNIEPSSRLFVQTIYYILNTSTVVHSAVKYT